MTKGELVGTLLREKDVFPPSVQDSQYGVDAEMTRNQVIEKTLREMGRHRPWGRRGDDIDFLTTVIAELQRRLPDGSIKNCGAFKYLNATCCDSCHTASPHVDMDLIDLPDGSTGWVCENIRWAIFPERYAEYQEGLRNSPVIKLLRKSVDGANRTEN